MNWTKQHPGWTMFGAMIGLLLFLWGLAIPLSAAPAPIGAAAEQFAEGARVTVWLTLIAGIAGTQDCFPAFDFGLENERIIAAMERSLETRAWEKVAK